ncbi:acyl-CoA desaturase [Saxibacter everestensis]|uniref:Acyl-CoA desaturase n=1 Tax=Saxibacter everestensis TaxID=2909229 RepID=A0ABY8QTK3_9MICO|nr:acyl-CoA desaturase [Brevibacteriaceae bacterium ZFBP1038]
MVSTSQTELAGARRPSAQGQNQQVSDFAELTHQLESAGLLRRRYGYYWTKLSVIVLTFAACGLLFVWIGDTWWQMFTAVIFAVVLTQTAFLAHDAAHRQIFKSSKWNDWISLILGNLFVGLSYAWWEHKHGKHHGNPNKAGTDPDIGFKVLAFTPEQEQSRRTPLTRWLVARQGWFFFPLLLLEGISLHTIGIRRVFGRGKLNRRWVEIVFLAIRLGGYLALVLLVLSPGKAAVFLAIQLGLFGLYMGASFAPNHKGMPIVPKNLKLDFIQRQVLMSRNIRGNRFIDTAMGGLNYQIEHHLFPSMPRPNLRRAQPIIAAYCAKHEVRYTETTLWHSYGIVVRYLNQVGLRARDPFDCPLIAQRRSF